MPFCNSRQGTAWGTASLGVLVRQGGGVEGGGVGALFKVQDDLGCSSPLTGLLSCPHPRCRSTRCAAQRSWVNSSAAAPQGALCVLPPRLLVLQLHLRHCPRWHPFPLPLLPVDGGLLHYRASTRNRCVRGRGWPGLRKHLLGAAETVGGGGGWLSQSPGCRQ